MRVKMTIMAALATLAGSIGLYPLFSSASWFWHAVGAVVSVAVGGLVVRRFRVPSVISALGGLAALHLYLTVAFTSEEAVLGVIPTRTSLARLAELVGEGWDAANQYAAPVPLVPGISLMVAAGVGVVAVVVDLLAVRLRRAAPAGLPLLAMYSVPAAVRDEGISWLAFGVGALGFLALLMTDAREQVGGWGRAVFTRYWSDDSGERAPGARPDSSALAASGRRIGAAAVALAVLIPMAIPGIQPRGMFGSGSGGSGGGTQTVTTPDPMVSLKRELTRRDDSIVLTYTSDSPRPEYLRMHALDRFDGERWTYTQLKSTSKDRLSEAGALPAPPGLLTAQTREVRTEVRVRRQVKGMTFLPLPYAPSLVSIKGDWRMHGPTLQVYSLSDSAGGREYRVTSTQAEPTETELRASVPVTTEITREYTSVPDSVPGEVRRMAQEITAGTSNMHEKAVKLQQWFTRDGGYTYSLDAPAPKQPNDLVDFLQHSKRGYCEQFAASMALLARVLGIPARVAMGYTPGTRDPSGTWVVRSRDAHAWPELYFEGTGWVRFEPTPAGAQGQGTATTPSYSERSSESGTPRPGEEVPRPEASEGASQTPGAQSGRRNRAENESPELAPVLEEDKEGGFPVGWLSGGVLVLLLLAAPMVARALARRRRWAAIAPGSGPGDRGSPGGAGPSGGGGAGGAAHAAWREMHADAQDHGLRWLPSDSPRAAARRLGDLLELEGDAAKALGRIAHAEELARYSRSRTAVPAETLRADVRTVREAFATSVGTRARLRARYMPPSALTGFRAAAARLMEAAARLDIGGRLPRLPRR
ncbi:transglutaminase TgpA family protein [Spirillospora sp. CA-294931]|uniref:transglutaminase TgpA family protein n=1 Tax=Spirillospora sp. CA-294931 TaxID=3240042 RepID=UPI003D89EA29